MTDLATNALYYGDNLDILRRYLPDAAVDLVYLDPPFNSNRDGVTCCGAVSAQALSGAEPSPGRGRMRFHSVAPPLGGLPPMPLTDLAAVRPSSAAL